MNITRISQASGIKRTRDLPITEDQLALWKGGALIQDAFPHLSPDDREFILTGITKEEWDETFNEDEE